MGLGEVLQPQSRLAAEIGFKFRGLLGHKLCFPATEPVFHDPECGQKAEVVTESVRPMGQMASPP